MVKSAFGRSYHEYLSGETFWDDDSLLDQAKTTIYPAIDIDILFVLAWQQPSGCCSSSVQCKTG